jgi:hypothetical protein
VTTGNAITVDEIKILRSVKLTKQEHIGRYYKRIINIKMSVFWVMAPCSLVEVYRRFRRAYCSMNRAPCYVLLYFNIFFTHIRRKSKSFQMLAALLKYKTLPSSVIAENIRTLLLNHSHTVYAVLLFFQD